MLSFNNALICNILKTALAGGDFPLTESISWDEVSRELAVQTVAALPADVIIENPMIPDSVKRQWENMAWAHAVRWEQILYAQDEMVKIMADSDIPMVILKGTAAAMYYPEPKYRSMGDIDFLVREDDYGKALGLLRDYGYVLSEPEDSENYHYTLEKDGIVIELHRRLAKIPKDAAGNFLMEQVHVGLEHAEWHCLKGYRFPVLPWLSNGVVLLQHIRQHLRDGLGMRQIIDWMMYVDKELDDEKYPRFQEILQRIGLEPLALHVTRMCQIYLGLREEGISWCVYARQETCEALMEYIMEQGNFGCKVGQEGKGLKALNRHKTGIHMLVWMQRQGRRHWKAANKHPFLRHFAFLHEFGWYLSWLLHRKNPVRALASDIRNSRRRRKMFRRLLS